MACGHEACHCAVYLMRAFTPAAMRWFTVIDSKSSAATSWHMCRVARSMAWATKSAAPPGNMPFATAGNLQVSSQTTQRGNKPDGQEGSHSTCLDKEDTRNHVNSRRRTRETLHRQLGRHLTSCTSYTSV